MVELVTASGAVILFMSSSHLSTEGIDLNTLWLEKQRLLNEPNQSHGKYNVAI